LVERKGVSTAAKTADHLAVYWAGARVDSLVRTPVAVKGHL